MSIAFEGNIIRFKNKTRLESTGTSPVIWTLDFGLKMTQGYQLNHAQRLLKFFFDNVLLDHVGLNRV